jgi:hypothetical protein
MGIFQDASIPRQVGYNSLFNQVSVQQKLSKKSITKPVYKARPTVI